MSAEALTREECPECGMAFLQIKARAEAAEAALFEMREVVAYHARRAESLGVEVTVAEERAERLREVLEEIDECGSSMRLVSRALAADDAARGEA